MMKSTNENAARAYISPSCHEFQIMFEGLLCASTLTISDWEENDDVL